MRVNWLEIQGFRSYGASAQRITFHPRLTVLSAPNSQGKSSTIEALEFLLTGSLERREEFTNYKAEFAHSLRNAHLDQNEKAYVAAELDLADGKTRTLKRVLESDYTSQTDCESHLLLDGEPVDAIADLGVNLGSAPMRLPILMQHTLRYAVNARPKKRAEFLKSLLDVSDVDLVRDEIRKTASSILDEEYPVLTRLDDLKDDSSLVGSLLTGLNELDSPTAEAVLTEAESAARAALDEIDEAKLPKEEGSNEGAGTRLAALIADREEAVYPVNDLDAQEVAEPDQVALKDDPIRAYNTAVASVERSVQRLAEVFEAVLDLDDVRADHAPLDCPVCETPQALTVQRIEVMRRQLRTTADFRAARSRCEDFLSAFMADLDRALRRTTSALPSALRWEDEEVGEHRKVAEQLLEPEVLSGYKRSISELEMLASKLQLVRDRQARVLWIAKSGRFRTRKGEAVDLEALQEAAARLEESYVALVDQLKVYKRAVAPVCEELHAAVRDEAGLEPYALIAEIAQKPKTVADDLGDRQARKLAQAAVTEALEDLDTARTAVLDEKFGGLSKQVREWWKQIRPDDLTGFERLERRGRGLRFIDFKASLRPSSSTDEPEVRNAGGVFSDSQLNALGVSTFLARWTREPLGFLLLDDPVLASDEGHMATFGHNVVSKLLEETRLQVIVTTYSEQFGRRLQDIYKHLPPTAYSLSIPVPKAGTVAERVHDSLDSMLRRAEKFAGSSAREMRKTGARLLRDAAERFCKELIVKKRREQGEKCSITDYDGKSFSQLAPKARKHFAEPAHIGKFEDLSQALSPGSHDDRIPPGSDLSVALGNLRRFCKDYLWR